MAKTRTQYVCQRCGRIAAAYVGKCPQCGEFGTMVEQIVSDMSSQKSTRRRIFGGHISKPERLVDIKTDGLTRMPLPLCNFPMLLSRLKL